MPGPHFSRLFCYHPFQAQTADWETQREMWVFYQLFIQGQSSQRRIIFELNNVFFYLLTCWRQLRRATRRYGGQCRGPGIWKKYRNSNYYKSQPECVWHCICREGGSEAVFLREPGEHFPCQATETEWTWINNNLSILSKVGESKNMRMDLTLISFVRLKCDWFLEFSGCLMTVSCFVVRLKINVADQRSYQDTCFPHPNRLDPD